MANLQLRHSMEARQRHHRHTTARNKVSLNNVIQLEPCVSAITCDRQGGQAHKTLLAIVKAQGILIHAEVTATMSTAQYRLHKCNAIYT